MEDFDKYTDLVIICYNRFFKSYWRLKQDLMQEGYLGLWKACQKFDETKGFKFTTFAFKCVKNEMLMLIREEKNHIQKDCELMDCCFEEESVLPDIPSELLKSLNGYTQKEIGKEKGVSQAMVSRIVKKQKEELKEYFKEN